MVEIIDGTLHVGGVSVDLQFLPDLAVQAITELVEQRDWGIVEIEKLEARIEEDEEILLIQVRKGAKN